MYIPRAIVDGSNAKRRGRLPVGDAIVVTFSPHFLHNLEYDNYDQVD